VHWLTSELPADVSCLLLFTGVSSILSAYDIGMLLICMRTSVSDTAYHVTVCRAVIGMLTVGNMMSLVTKGKVDVTDTVGKVTYRQFKEV